LLIIVAVSASTGGLTKYTRYYLVYMVLHLRQPVRPESERRTASRQTVPTKAPVEAETSTIILIKGCVLLNFI